MILNIDKTHHFDSERIPSTDETTTISFDSGMSSDEILSELNNIYEYEEHTVRDDAVVPDIILDLKKIGTQKLLEIMSVVMTRETLVDPSTLININLLINGYGTLEDEVFNEDKIFVNNAEEFIDLKIDLGADIKQLRSRVVYWFLACLRSIHKVEFTGMDTPVEVPMMYEKILTSNALINLGQMFSQVNDIVLKDLPMVKNAYCIMAELVGFGAVNNQLLTSLAGFIDNKQKE